MNEWMNYPFDRRIGSEVTVRWNLTLGGQEEQRGDIQPGVVWGYFRVDGVCHLSPSCLSWLVNVWGINCRRRQPTASRDVFHRIRSPTRREVWCPARRLRHHYGFGTSRESIKWFLIMWRFYFSWPANQFSVFDNSDNDNGDSFIWSLKWNHDECIAYFIHQMLTFLGCWLDAPFNDVRENGYFCSFFRFIKVFSMNVLRFFLFNFCYM